MNGQTIDIQRALKDIHLLRNILNQSGEGSASGKLSGITLDANLLLQVIAFGAAFALGLTEIFGHDTMMQTLISGAQSHELMMLGIGLMASVIVGLLIALYFILWRAARHNGEDFSSYLGRNFRYAQNLSFISDLLIKFACLSLLILAGKPQWIAPALLAFTGDYLLQGRFFTLPTKIAVVLGTACLAGAIAQFLQDSSLLSIPLAAFCLVTACSIGRLVLRYRQQTAASA